MLPEENIFVGKENSFKIFKTFLKAQIFVKFHKNLNNLIIHDIGTSEIFEFEPSKSFVMFLLINPESRNLF